ncbi:MAG: DNA-methyltransferase [Candidatus Odinarchaeia archaeon]
MKKIEIYPERVLKEISVEEVKIDTHHKIIFSDSRSMKEIKDNSVQLILTSPPYPMIEMWDQLFTGLGCDTFEKMHKYLRNVWEECYRILIDGGIACINIGDATRRINGKFRLYPNHSKIIEHCEEIGFTTLPYILWKKPTTKPNSFLGSGFLPPNAYVTLDCEFILIFRKGDIRKFKPKDPHRYASYFTKEERDKWFSQIWNISGEKQENNTLKRRTAAFPEELAYRLIRMFSVIGDTVVDPFLGTGTTTKVAIENHRNSIGYEVNKELMGVIKKRLRDTVKTVNEGVIEVEYIT